MPSRWNAEPVTVNVPSACWIGVSALIVGGVVSTGSRDAAAFMPGRWPPGGFDGSATYQLFAWLWVSSRVVASIMRVVVR